MRTTNEELITEALDEITAALQDPKGLVSHQRRLAFLLSAGGVALIETFLQRRQAFKPGAKINHLWLKKKKENVLKLLQRQITCPVEKLPELDAFLDAAYALEKDRNQMAYGKLVGEEKLRELIAIFLKFRKEVEHA